MKLKSVMALFMVCATLAGACDESQILDSSKINKAYFVQTNLSVGSQCTQSTDRIRCCASAMSAVYLETNVTLTPVLSDQFNLTFNHTIYTGDGDSAVYVRNSTSTLANYQSFRNTDFAVEATTSSVKSYCFGAAGTTATVSAANRSFVRFTRSSGSSTVNIYYGPDNSVFYLLQACTIPDISAFRSVTHVFGTAINTVTGTPCMNVTYMNVQSNNSLQTTYHVTDIDGNSIQNCTITNTDIVSGVGYSPVSNVTDNNGLTPIFTYDNQCTFFPIVGYHYYGNINVDCPGYSSQSSLVDYYSSSDPTVKTIIMYQNASDNCTKCIQLWDGSGNGGDLSGAAVSLSAVGYDESANGFTDADGKICAIFQKGYDYRVSVLKEGFKDSERQISDICDYVSDVPVPIIPNGMNSSAHLVKVQVNDGNLSILESVNRIYFYNCNDDSQYAWLISQNFEDSTGVNCRSVYGGDYTNGSGYYEATIDLSSYDNPGSVLVVSRNAQYSDSVQVRFLYSGESKSVTLDYSAYPGYYAGQTPYSYVLSVVNCDNSATAISAQYTITSSDKSFVKSGTANNASWTRNVSEDTYSVSLSAVGYTFNPTVIWIGSETEKVLCMNPSTISYSNFTAWGAVLNESGSYLPSIKVTVTCVNGYSSSASTNSSGDFKFSRIPDSVSCSYSAGGDGTYSPDSFSYTVTSNNAYVGSLVINKASTKTFLQQFYLKYEIVSVSADSTYAPRSGVKILVSCDDGKSYNSQETNGEGYAASYLPVGETCYYTASYDGFRTENDKITINPQTINLKSISSLRCILSGQITQNGIGVKDISYVVYDKGNVAYSGLSGNDGIYSVNLLCGEDYTVIAKNGNCSVTEATAFAKGESGSSTVNIELGTCDADKENKKAGVINTMWSMSTVFEWIIIAFFIFVLLAVIAKAFYSGSHVVNGFWSLLDSFSGKREY